MKQAIIDHLKNSIGWKIRRKIVVFSVDDYGNVRLDSSQARENMDRAGLKVHSRFDAYDTLETREDLEMLYETLGSVKDQHGRAAVFTPFALPCNINFERMASEGYQQYYYERLPQTYLKLTALQPKAYEGTWALWQEGIAKGLMRPQFHGREHLNLKVLEEKLAQRDHEVLTALQNRSYTSLSGSGYPTISYTAAFDFWEERENDRLQDILVDGLMQFEQVYGYKANHFMPPTSKIHPIHFPILLNQGIRYMDINQFHRQHIGSNHYKTSWNYTGKKNEVGQWLMVRNVVFEPTDKRGFDWANYTFRQIAAAFHLYSPAIISSHRVNFCGHINPQNREKGIMALRKLLYMIVKKWPEVEFMSANQLGDLISSSGNERSQIGK